MSVTVLLTVYNGMPYLQEAVASILTQSYSNFTFLIVNNGSTDSSAQYLQTLSDPRLEIHHLTTNLGRTGVLNFALGLVKTDLVAIIDADDLAATHRLQSQVAFMNQHPEVALVGSNVAYINEIGNTIGVDTFPIDHETLRDNLPVHNQFAHAACTFRLAAAQEAGGYPAEFPYAQDFGLWIKMMQHGERVASMNNVLAYIRVHAAQATKSAALLQVRNEDNLRLSEAMLGIPGFSVAAQQAALLRMAGALWCLQKKDQALGCVWKVVRVSPLGLLVNPLLWKRVKKECLKQVKRFIVKK